MLAGLGLAFLNYKSYVGSTETIMQQIFQVTETIMIIVGFYVFGKGISFNAQKSKREAILLNSIDENEEKKNSNQNKRIQHETQKIEPWKCTNCGNENTINKSICEKCNK